MRLAIPALLAGLVAIATAQEGRQVSCRFLCFGEAGGMSAVVPTEGGGEIECPLPGTKLSDPVTCPVVDGSIRFLSEDGGSPLATARVPGAVSRAIVVFVPPPAGKAGDWRTVVIDDSPKSFPDGGAYVCNFHQKEIRFIIGEHRGMLKPGQANGYEMPKKRDDFNMAPVVVELSDGENWRKANESSLRFLPRVRYLMFVYVDPRSGRPRVRTIQDVAMPRVPER